MARKKKIDFGFTPSIYQEKFFDFVQHGVGNAVIKATAGAGKTQTVISAMKLIPSKEKCLFLAFNKSIADELNKKLEGYSNVTARTSHSLGLLMLRRNLGNGVDIDEYKYRTYTKSHITELTTVSEQIQTRFELEDYINSILLLNDFARFNYCQSEKEIDEIAKKYSIPINFDECQVVLKILKWGKENTETIDYTDMIWLPVELNLKPLGLQYDWVMIDECQDQSIISIELFKKCFKHGTRFVAIGDKKQCQPIGTKILMNDGTIKNIEDVSVNDKVVTYLDKSACKFKGFKYTNNKPNIYASRITAVERHKHQGNVITIYTKNGNKSSYTPEHLCYAKFNDKKCEGKYVLYLMCNEKNMWRIGITKLFNDSDYNQSFGMAARMRSEKCNKGWILDVFDNEKSARIAELTYSLVYKIPQITFCQQRAGCKTITDEEVEIYFQNLNEHYNIQLQAIKLLEHFNRKIEYPFFVMNKGNNIKIGGNMYRNGREYLSNYYACNLLKDVMDVPVYDETNIRIRTHGKDNKVDHYKIPIYSNITDITIKNETIDVISLNVEKEHNYVADGILTHNCIYNFAGSSEDAFDKICNMPNTQIFELPISYRCDKKIVQLANKFVPTMQSREGAEDGIIFENCHIKDLQEGDMVLARTKAPLVKLYTKLLTKKMACYIKGQDIASNLINIINSIDEPILNADLKKDGFFLRLYEKLFKDRNKLMQKRNLDYDDATLASSIMEQYDNINTLLTLAKGLEYKDELIEHINTIFKEDERGICLSTIHKAKGLEADNVYILCHSKMPSSLAKQEWEKKQEQNLIYVAYTRAKHKLGFISEKEVPPCGSLDEPMQIINDLMYIENKICKVLNTEPTVRMSNVDIAKFNISKSTKIEEIQPEIETINKIKEYSDISGKGGKSLLAHLDELANKYAHHS